VLLDANMPEMDGLAVAFEVTKHTEQRDLRLMIQTSTGQYGDQSRCRELGIAAYLTKPIRAAELREAIGRTLGVRSHMTPDVSERIGAELVRRLRVLLVEDNVVNQRVAIGLLKRRGHDVTLARDGSEALSILEHETFDVVLMDLQMPVMGGFEATAAIRAREKETGKHLRIIAMTAHAMNGDRERCLAAGMDGYLSKPVDPRMLFAAIEQEPAASPAHEPPERPATATFDAKELRARVAGDEQLLADVIRIFLEDCPIRLAAIKDAVDRRDADAIRTTAHALKGAAGNLSATGLFEAARVLERIGSESRLDAAEAAWRVLSTEAANVIDALRRFESGSAAA
jgi:CheY-like chemotaxis protein/HPt (histidine-containing phosphotransfer) domain-containing protein